MRLSIVAVSVVLFAALSFFALEVMSLGYFYIEHSSLFYMANKRGLKLNDGLTDYRRRLTYQLHPYVGFVRSSGDGSGSLNRQGYFSSLDWPYKPANADEVVVLIVGGSVAVNLAAVESKSHILSGLLEKTLFPGRKVVVLNYAMQGHKQPQQLLGLAYWLTVGQKADLVISVDGFNEVMIGLTNWARGDEPSFPSTTIWTPLALTMGGQEALEAGLKMMRAQQIEWRATDCDLAVCYYGLRTLAWFVSSGAEAAGRDVFAPEAFTPDLSVARRLADQWERATIMADELANLWGARFAVFLQPNQYAPTARDVRKLEDPAMLDWQSIYARSVEAGYPELKSRLAKLNDAGVKAFDGTGYLDDFERQAYGDSCCHMNTAAYEHILLKIGQALAGDLSLQQK